MLQLAFVCFCIAGLCFLLAKFTRAELDRWKVERPNEFQVRIDARESNIRGARKGVFWFSLSGIALLVSGLLF